MFGWARTAARSWLLQALSNFGAVGATALLAVVFYVTANLLAVSFVAFDLNGVPWWVYAGSSVVAALIFVFIETSISTAWCALRRARRAETLENESRNRLFHVETELAALKSSLHSTATAAVPGFPVETKDAK